ncbi:MAG: hypothetical protein EON54_06075 [Alcaligenaceae bacterium]|nr:MAG: hypothetical protein EON54_06075 [Alcaligenaceae bacterium]
MSDPATHPPRARDLAVSYAYLLASISDRLELGELEAFIAIGVALKQSVRRVPIASGEDRQLQR